MVATLFDEESFLSPHGLRSVSKRHATTYFVPGLPGGGIDYQPAESRTAMYGGNSNWRGPVWMPTNYLVIRALLQYDQFFGADLLVEYPTGSGEKMSLGEVAADLSDRLVSSGCPTPTADAPSTGGRTSWTSTLPGVATCSSSSTSTVTSAWASAPPTRPAGPRWSPT